MRATTLAVLLSLAVPAAAWASDAGAPTDPLPQVALYLVAILLVAKVGGDLALRAGQPAVLGELAGGVALGNLRHVGYSALTGVGSDPFVDLLARLGVLLLLFEAGLGCTVGQMAEMGFAPLVAAGAGAGASFVLAWAASAWLLPAAGTFTHALVGVAVTATSVGITVRVFNDLGLSRSLEARSILAAAVADDILGLALLAAVTGSLQAAPSSAPRSLAAIGWVFLKVVAGLGGSATLGVLLAGRLFSAAGRLRGSGVLLATGLAFCFAFAFVASSIGLAPIVGAYAAGLILEENHEHGFRGRGERSLQELVGTMSSFLAPIFFVLMGVRTDLASFAAPGTLLLAAVLALAAAAGKQVCGAAIGGAGVNRLAIGIGMIPRGEVTLIFADTGLKAVVNGAPLFDPAIFSALVAVVLVTTLVTPPLLQWSLARQKAGPPPGSHAREP